MATLHLHKIQHTIFLVATFLLQFSSLHFPSLAYDPQDMYFINCGSENDVRENNNNYIGESKRSYQTDFIKSSIETNQSTVPSSLYQSARIFRSNSSYTFDTFPNKTYLQDDGSDRPSMGDVLWDLEYALQLQRGAIQREPHEDSSSSASVSIQLPNVRRLPSLSTLTEMDDMSMGMVNDESNSAEDSVFSQLKIDDAR